MSIILNGHTIAGAPIEGETANMAAKSDLTSIIATGATNATGATIASGTYFYLNGSLVVAKANIASGASFTENTNYEAVTAGGLNSLKSALTLVDVSSYLQNVNNGTLYQIGNIVFFSFYKDGITSSANTQYTLNVIKDGKRPKAAMNCSVFPGSASLPTNVQAQLNTSGNLIINHNDTALSSYDARFTGNYLVD